MEDRLLLIVGITTSFSVIALTFLITVLARARNKKRKIKVLNGVDVLQLLKQTKPFPLGTGTTWKLHSYRYEQRIWKSNLMLDLLQQPITVFGCYSKVKGSSQAVISTIRDITKYPEWEPGIHQVRYITMATEADSGVKAKGNVGVPVQHDIISIETDVSPSRLLDIINTTSRKLQGDPLVRRVKVIHRYWHREENGCCWLLEFCEADQSWLFYLAQPVEEIDQCLLTVVCCPQGKSRDNLLPAIRLGAIQNYIFYRNIKCAPLVSVSLPTADTAEEEVAATPVANLQKRSSGESSPSWKNRYDSFTKPESTFIQKFKNLIEEKKEWYEERKRKNASTAGGANPNSAKSEMATSILHEDCEEEEEEELPAEEENMEVVTSSLNSEGQARQSSLAPSNGGNVSKSKKLLKLLQRSSAVNTLDGSPPRKNSLEENGSEAVKETGIASKVGMKLNLMRKMKSLDDSGAEQTDPNKEEAETQLHNLASQLMVLKDMPEGEKLEAGYRTVANQAAAEIMAEKVKVSNIDISKPYEEQAEQTGGWIYCGLEKDVVILRKIHDEGSPVQSYLGKGLIPLPPKQVFEALRQARTRFTYDEMLKKLDVIHDFGNGMTIAYLYHEVSQLFRREARDFCVLQSERTEGNKFIVAIRSVGWPACVEKDDITRGKFLASGWIIEPAARDNKVYSMVTYIVQMELGVSKSNTGYLIEELAAKQPISIAYLRQFLAPSSVQRSGPSRPSSSGQLKKKRPVLTSSSSTGTLASFAAGASSSGTLTPTSEPGTPGDGNKTMAASLVADALPE